MVASPCETVPTDIENSYLVLSLRNFINPISKPYNCSSVCLISSCLDSDLVRVVASSSQKPARLKSGMLPDSGPMIVPTGSL